MTSQMIPGPPKIRVHGPEDFELLEDWTYEWDKEGYPLQRLIIFAGFRCDLASVPKQVHSIIGKLDLGLHPALTHDALYRCKGNPDRSEFLAHMGLVDNVWVPAEHIWSRSEADHLFGRHMREAGVPGWKRKLAYLAVRIFGRGRWK